jgi:hypothetical protein
MPLNSQSRISIFDPPNTVHSSSKMRFISLALFIGVFISGCTKDKALVTGFKVFVCDSTITYTSTVKTIMDTKCGLPTCHDAMTPGGGLNFSIYSDCRDVALTHNILLCSIKHDSTCGYKAMPYPPGSPKISDSMISILSCWVANGSRQ